jgi:hypothetical protein
VNANAEAACDAESGELIPTKPPWIPASIITDTMASTATTIEATVIPCHAVAGFAASSRSVAMTGESLTVVMVRHRWRRRLLTRPDDLEMRHHPFLMVLEDVAVVHPFPGPIVRHPGDANRRLRRDVDGVFP